MFVIPASSTISSPVFTGTSERTDGVPVLNLFILSAGLYLFSKLKGFECPNHPFIGFYK